MQPIRELFAQIRAHATKWGINLPMAKLNDAIARSLFDRPYSALIAAENAGSIPAMEWPPRYLEATCAEYRIDPEIMQSALVFVAPVPAAFAAPMRPSAVQSAEQLLARASRDASNVRTLANIGFPNEWGRILSNPKLRAGLILISAPTGHGGRDTQMAIAHSRAGEDEMKHILYRELEFERAHELEPGRLWVKAIESVRSPIHANQLVMLDDIRDSEMAACAIELASTNLVIARIHAQRPTDGFRRVAAFAGAFHDGMFDGHHRLSEVWMASLVQCRDPTTRKISGHLVASPWACPPAETKEVSAKAEFEEDGEVHTWVCEDVLHQDLRSKNNRYELNYLRKRSLGV